MKLFFDTTLLRAIGLASQDFFQAEGLSHPDESAQSAVLKRYKGRPVTPLAVETLAKELYWSTRGEGEM